VSTPLLIPDLFREESVLPIQVSGARDLEHAHEEPVELGLLRRRERIEILDVTLPNLGVLWRPSNESNCLLDVLIAGL
jgi:hypothetical protein